MKHKLLHSKLIPEMSNLHNIFLSVVPKTLLALSSTSNLKELIKIAGLYKTSNLQLLLLKPLLAAKAVQLHLPVIKPLPLLLQGYLPNVLKSVPVGSGLLLL